MLHPSSEQALRTQLAVALRERDDAEAALKLSNSLNGHRSQRIEELEAENERLGTALHAYIDGHELALTRAETAEEALAAARRECDLLRAMLRGCRPLVAKAHVEADEGTEEGWFDFLRRIDAALAAGGEGK